MDPSGCVISPFIPADDISYHFLGNEMVLFAEGAQRLYHLNTTAAFIWCCCEDRLAPEAIVQAVADTFNIPIDSARQDVLGVLAEWQRLGLFADRRHQPPMAHKDDAVPITAEWCDPVSFPIEYKCEHRYRLIDTCFRVRFADRDEERIVHPILAHLECPADVAFHITIDLFKDRQGYVLLHEAVPIVRCATLAELGPLIHGHILLTAYPAAECLLVIHAAAISRGRRCILLPGASGSGKSTLAAALMSRNFVYFTDELALLTRDTHRLRPVPVSLSLKEGSWSALAPFHPIVKDLPVHLRQDGKTVRYLPPFPSGQADALEQGYPVQCIVFPIYQAQSPTVISALSQAEALYRLTEAGYDVNGRLDAARVGELVAWIADVDCYELCFSCLPEAMSLVNELLPSITD